MYMLTFVYVYVNISLYCIYVIIDKKIKQHIMLIYAKDLEWLSLYYLTCRQIFDFILNIYNDNIGYKVF